MTKKRTQTCNTHDVLSRRTYVLAILMSVALVACSPKEYNFDCFNGMYQVNVDDTKDFITVTWVKTATSTKVGAITEYRVALDGKNTIPARGTTLYSYYFTFGKRSFFFEEPMNTLEYGLLECTKV